MIPPPPRSTLFPYTTLFRSLNPNVKKVRADQRAYLENILAQQHGSVLEHAQFTFVFHNVTRVLTHELARHRPGTADRKSTRLNSSHPSISYAVFCLKKKSRECARRCTRKP